MMLESMSGLFFSATAVIIAGGSGLAAALRSGRNTRAMRTQIAHLRAEAEGRDRAEAASEAKSRFVATVSHEIRTPLNGILGMAELLLGSELDAEQNTYVEAIRSSGAALASLIDEILDFSKIEAGKIDLAEESFNLPHLVEGAAELLAPRAQGKGLEIACFIAADVPPSFTGDAGRLRQILFNLVGNAVKFTERGGVGIRVVTEKDGAALRFEIIDTGPGISEDRQASIFDEFDQANDSLPRQHEGTGLGLAISRRIAERMGGSLELATTSPHGSVFVMRLPLPDHMPALKPLAKPTHAGLRALIVADSPFEAPFLRERLAELEITVFWVAEEEAALALLARAAAPDVLPPDIVIVDCALGAEQTRRLGLAARAVGVTRSLILFSPFERRAFGQSTIQGFDGWLVKPVRAQSLLARLGDSALASTSAVKRTRAHETQPQQLEILLAEDNEINALLATRHLERLGAHVTRCSDGHAAIALAEAAIAGLHPAFDVIFIDIRMPGEDGFAVARRIRQAEQRAGRSSTRLIALTADIFDTAGNRAAEAGIDEVMAKPVDFRRIGRVLEDVAAHLPESRFPRTALSA